MKLVHKLTLSLLVSACGVFGVYGVLTVRREETMLEGAVVADAHRIARTMGISFSRVWRAEGQEAALRLLSDASAGDDRLTFRLLDLAGEEPADLEAAQAVRLRGGHPVVSVNRERPSHLRIYLPLKLSGAPPAALLLQESLDHEEAYVAQTKARIGIATLALVLISGVIAFGIGERIVGNPMRLLMAKADRVGKGDLAGPLELAQTDEIGQLAARMNRMCEDLSRETTRRVEALDQLRHVERLATVGRLASGIAHELGTPLNVVMGRALMNAGEEGEASADVGQNSRIIVEQTQRMSAIIRQLLDFARRGAARKEPADVREVARRLVELLEPLANEAEVELVAELPTDPVLADIDAAQIEQALTNVVVNAIQASPSGGQVRVDVARADEPRPHVRIGVRDQGPGMTEEVRDRLFEPFFTTKDVGEGTGLGLPVAHGLVTDHQGWIDVESEVGQGSCFTVCLPQDTGGAR